MSSQQLPHRGEGFWGLRRTNTVANQIHRRQLHKTLVENPHILVMFLHTLLGMQHHHSLIPEIDASTLSLS